MPFILTVVMKVRWKTWEAYKKYILAALVAAGVLLFMKYILPYVLPFFFALCLVAVMYPFLERMEERFHIRKGMVASLVLAVWIALLGLIFWCLGAFVCGQIKELCESREVVEDCFCNFIKRSCDTLESRFGVESESLEQTALKQIDEIGNRIQIQIVPKFMNRSFQYIRLAVSVFGFWAVTFVAAVLLAKDYYRLREQLRTSKALCVVAEIGGEIGRMVWNYLKAQALILCVISVICVTGLLGCGMERALPLGIVAGIMDALPFIGTGIVLMPMALWEFVQGNYFRMAAVFVIYVFCALAREFLEPKLLGRKMGIYPIFILLAIYAGIKFFGLSGVVLGPFSCLVIRELYRRMDG